MRTIARLNLVLAGALAAAGAVAWDQTAQRLHSVTTVIVPGASSKPATGSAFLGGESVVSTTVLVHPHTVIAAVMGAAAVVAAVAGIWGLRHQAT